MTDPDPIIYVPLSTQTAHGIIQGFPPFVYEDLTALWNEAANQIACIWTQYIYAVQSANSELAAQYAQQASDELNQLAMAFNERWANYYEIRYFVQNSEGKIRAYGGIEKDRGVEIQLPAEVTLAFSPNPTSVTVIRNSNSARQLTVYLSAPFANLSPGTGSSCVNILRRAVNKVIQE